MGPQAFFVVDQTQLAIVTRFGSVKQTIVSPGIRSKAPFVDSVTYFEKRKECKEDSERMESTYLEKENYKDCMNGEYD